MSLSDLEDKDPRTFHKYQGFEIDDVVMAAQVTPENKELLEAVMTAKEHLDNPKLPLGDYVVLYPENHAKLAEKAKFEKRYIREF